MRYIAIVLGGLFVLSGCPGDRTSVPGTDAGSPDATTDALSDAGPACLEGPWSVQSPSGDVVVDLEVAERNGEADYGSGDRLYYRVAYRGDAVVEWSPLGLVTDLRSWEELNCAGEVVEAEVNAEYSMPTGKRLARTNSANELTVRFADGSGELDLVFRAYDDGVAFRYQLTTETSVTVGEEQTGFRIPAGADVWMAPYDIGGVAFGGSYEQTYRSVEVGRAATPQGSSWAFPVLYQAVEDGPWALLTEADLDRSYAGTRLHGEPVDRVYRIRFPSEAEGAGVGETHPTAESPQTPWRVLIVGPLATVVESTLVDDVSRPSTVTDASWIEPGRVAWSWFSQDTGGPDLQRAYIDFAGRMGWEYVLVDAKWDQWDTPETTVPQLVAEAADQGVEIILWYNSGGPHTANTAATPLDLMHIADTRRAEFEKIAGWGVAGVKIDFFNSDKQDRIAQYLDILDDAAEHELLVNFHGATLPRGWQRTYPHLMTHEAVRGEEFYKFLGPPEPDDHVRYALIRNVVGSMDYTPGAFDVPFEDGERPYGLSLALTVLFESGHQHLAGRADGVDGSGYQRLFERFDFAETLLSELPVAWEDTRLLSGHPDSHVVLARQSQRWWVSGVNATADEATYEWTLDFVEGDVVAECVQTGATADSLARETREVSGSESFSITVAAGDGFVCRF